MGAVAYGIAEGIRSLVWGSRSWDPVLTRLFGGQPGAAGVVVDERSAVAFAPFGASVIQIANPMASLPLHLYQRVGEGRERAREHPLDRPASREPNGEDSSFTFRRRTMQDALVFGVAYAEIVRNHRRPAGRALANEPN